MSTESTAYQSRLAELDQDFGALKQVFEALGIVNPMKHLTKLILTRMEANLSAPEFRDPHKSCQERLEFKDIAMKLCISQLACAKSIFHEIQNDDAEGFPVNVEGAKDWLNVLEDVLPKEEYEAVLKSEKELASLGQDDKGSN